MKRALIYFLIFCSFQLIAQSSGIKLTASVKFNKWLSPGFFKGYNVLYETRKTMQDFTDFKNYGGNLMQIGTFGFMKEDPPYIIQQNNIDSTDVLVNYCRATGIYYILAVRSGPGAYDTYQESQGTTGESRIWNTGNLTEQQLYADMLSTIITRYAGDSLFVGINLVVEPRPKVKLIPANNSAQYKYYLESVYNIHMDSVYNYFINRIRQNDSTLPVIIENFAYSTPELFPPYNLSDSYIVYSAHNYQPNDYTKAAPQLTKAYPGIYWSITYLSQKYYDLSFMRDVVFGKLREFQQVSGKPIFIGEFGLLYPQTGSNIYLNDVLSICQDYGWHFALWDWRRGQSKEWNIEEFDNDTLSSIGLNNWKTVLSYFYAPPAPKIISPLTYDIVRVPVLYRWDSLTSYTNFDIEVYNDTRLVFADSNISNSSYLDTLTSYLEGKHYYWRIRSKNPGGKTENCSQWTEPEDIYIPAITATIAFTGNKFILYGNYPNPFNPSTSIKYSLPAGSFLTLKVYDLLGREVQTLVYEYQQPGEHSVVFNSGYLASGIYLYKITAIENGYIVFNEVKRMILLK
jgi:hypothetical protein